MQTRKQSFGRALGVAVAFTVVTGAFPRETAADFAINAAFLMALIYFVLRVDAAGAERDAQRRFYMQKEDSDEASSKKR